MKITYLCQKKIALKNQLSIAQSHTVFQLIKINLKDGVNSILISERPTSILDFVHVIKGGRLVVGYIKDVKVRMIIY